MSDLLSKDLLSASPGVDPYHGDPDGPGGVADRHLEVDVVGLKVGGGRNSCVITVDKSVCIK